MVVALAGRRVDDPKAKAQQFPSVNLICVRERIRRRADLAPRAIPSCAPPRAGPIFSRWMQPEICGSAGASSFPFRVSASVPPPLPIGRATGDHCSTGS